MRNKLLSVIGVLLFVAGCVSAGNLFETKNIPDIKKGETHQKDVIKWFGNPVRTGVDDGEITWSYIYLKITPFTKIGKDLTLHFDSDGYVSSFSFTTTENELGLRTDPGEEEE